MSDLPSEAAPAHLAMHQNGTVNGAGVAPPRNELEGVPLRPLDVEKQLDGSRLLILGGTGFLGKIFWIMLLDRYPNIGKIILLVRSSKTATSQQRFWKDIATSEAMLPLKTRHGEGLEAFLSEKIVAIDGDVGNPNCGIDADWIRTNKGTIDAVINVAGVVDFNPPLDEALDTNAGGAQNLVSLCRALGDAPLFHTSTCYVVGNRKGLIQEDIPGTKYPFPRADELGRELWDPEREIKDCLDIVSQAKSRCEDAFRQSEFLERAMKNLLAKGEPTHGPSLESEIKKEKRRWVSDKLVDAGVERATHWGWPNVYTYTKSIGEQIIARSGLTYVIARPACCESTQEFPFPAWNEGIGTSAPIVFLIMKGHHQVVARDVILDFIPADIVCAGMILTLAELLEGTHKPVYQYGTSDVNPATSERLGELMGLYRRKHFQRTGKGNPFTNFLQAHYEPAIVDIERFDAFGPGQIARAARTFSKMLKAAPGPAARIAKPMAKSLDGLAYQEEKIDMIIRLFLPFTYDQKGPFSCANTREAYARVNAADRAKLDWTPEKLDWSNYFMNQHLPAMEKRVIPWMENRYKKELKPLKSHQTLVGLVDQMAERHEHAVALGRFEGDLGFTRVTYADVLARAEDVAARLHDLGVKKGDRVVLSAKNAPEWSIAYFGIMRVGAACVPMDPDMDAAGFVNVVKESEAKLAILDPYVEKKSGEALTASAPEVKRLDLVATTELDEALTRPFVEVREDDVASLIFTSGTTGKPKGVMLSHGNFTTLIASLAPLFPLSANDRVLSVLPLHHTFEFTAGMLLPFSRGTRIFYPGELTGDRITKALKQGRVTGMVGVPAVWQLLERRILSRVHSEGVATETLFNVGGEVSRWLSKNAGIDIGRSLFGAVHDELGGHVKWLISGGAALPKDTQKLFSGLGLKLTEGYGLTEAAPVLAVAKAGSAAGQVGKAIPGVELRIDAPDADGVGEVIARGPNVMVGYTDADATKETIDADGWLHTGDLGKLDKQGRLQIVGRSKDVVVTANGENLYPDDLERMLGNVAHIEELAFVGVDSPSGGERLACIAVPKTDDSVPRQERMGRADRALRDALAKLPYGKQPSVVHLYDAHLPRTSTRKVKRNEVRHILQRTIAATQRSKDEAGSTTPVRAAIAGLKGMKASEISGDMTIAGDLALDSLALTELLSALESKHGTIEPQELQNCRTVADVEHLVGTERQSLRPPKAEPAARYRIEGRAKPEDGKGEGEPAFTLPPEMQNVGKKLIGKLQDAFYGSMMSSRVSGRAFIPHNRNVLVVANHASHLDMGFVRHALGPYGEDVVTLAAQDYFFDKGSLKRAFFENLTNLKAIDRKSGLRASERQAGEVLSQGKTVLIFPEGTRSPDGDVHEFKSFLGHLVLTYGVDVLPLYIGGTREAMGKGSRVPTKRDIFARIGPVLALSDMKRLTEGLSYGDASREVAKVARAAVVALRDGDVLDLSRMETLDGTKKKKEHPLVTLFTELGTKFRPERVERPVSFYFTLGGEDAAKWTVKVEGTTCEIKQGKPENGTADCVLKTSPEIFTKIVNGYMPSPAEFISGAIKSNDVSLLMEFQKVFELG